MQEKLKAIKSKYGKVSLGETTVDMVNELGLECLDLYFVIEVKWLKYQMPIALS